MKKPIALIALLILLGTQNSVFAQSQPDFSVKGKVVDQNGKAFPYASALLLNANDSSLVKTTLVQESGEYSFSVAQQGSYMVSVSMLGMQTASSDVFELNKNIELPALTLVEDAQQLKSVTVSSTKPLIEHKIDRTVLNVENSLINVGNSALEVLRKAPGVMVDNNGAIQYKGKSGVMILINGKPTHLSQDALAALLKSTSANNISKIELMANAPAKYDAEGNAGIINIIMKKNTDEGVNGSVSLGYEINGYSQYESGLNLNAKKGKVNFYGSYNLNDGDNGRSMQLIRNFYDNGTNPSLTMSQISKSVYDFNDQSFRAGVDVALSQSHSLGLMVNGNFNKHDQTNTGPISFYNGQHQLDSLVTPDNINSIETSLMSYNFSYEGKLDTLGQTLSATFDYTSYDNASNQNYFTSYYDGENNELYQPKSNRGYLPSDIGIISGKLDYELPLKKGVKLAAGVKSSFVKSDNTINYEKLVDGNWENEVNKSNHFIYEERVHAAYLNFNKNWQNGWALQIGLRAEQTVSDANQITIDSLVNREYLEFFPTFFLKKDLKNNSSIRFSYSRRLSRPDYDDLNPFTFYIDEYTYSIGNPFLQPQFSNTFELSHSFKNKLFTTLSYSRTNDVITEVIGQNDDDHTGYETDENLSTLNNFNLLISAPIKVQNWWNANISANVFRNNYKGPINGQSFDRGFTSYRIRVGNTFSLPWDMKAEVNGFYNSSTIFGTINANPMHQVSLGLQKSLFDERASIKLNINDIYNNMDFRGSIKYHNIDMKINNNRNSRKLGMTFTWNFGNSKMKVNNRRKTGNEDEKSRL